MINTLEKFEECNTVSRSVVANTYSNEVLYDEQSQALTEITMSWVFKELTNAAEDYVLGCFMTITDSVLLLNLGFQSTDTETFVGLKQEMRHSDISIKVGLFQDQLLSGFGIALYVQKSTMATQSSN